MLNAKIEKPEALTNSEDIIRRSDVIMVARGDLGVELNPELVPLAQAQLISHARALNKPVIVATQMLESMITSARPTRAEVSDVSHAVANGADAIMLSGESAVGQFPIEAVEMMFVRADADGDGTVEVTIGMPVPAPTPTPTGMAI